MKHLYTLSEPVTIGDLHHQIRVTALRITSISINFEDAITKHGEAVVSVCMRDEQSDYPLNVVFRDPHGLELAKRVEADLGRELLEKLAKEGRLPAGDISEAE